MTAVEKGETQEAPRSSQAAQLLAELLTELLTKLLTELLTEDIDGAARVLPALPNTRSQPCPAKGQLQDRRNCCCFYHQ